MATFKTSTLARVRNILDLSLNWLAALALGFLVLVLALWLATVARADTITNRIYPSDPTLWTLIRNASKYATPVVAPDGSLTTPIQGGGGAGAAANNPVVVGAGEVDTFSVYVRYLAGTSPFIQLCMNGVILGQSADQCLTVNAATGTYAANDPGIIDYTVAPVGNDGWLRLSIVFKTAVGGMATPYVAEPPARQGSNMLFAVWGAQFVTGPYPGQLIQTVAGPASGVNQVFLTQLAGACQPQGTFYAPPTVGGQAIALWANGQVCIPPGTTIYGPASKILYYIYAYAPKYLVGADSYLSVSGFASALIDHQYMPLNEQSFGGETLYGFPVGSSAYVGFAGVNLSQYASLHGVADAGDCWLIWTAIYVPSFNGETLLASFGPSNPPVTLPEGQNFPPAEIVSFGVQQGGIFP